MPLFFRRASLTKGRTVKLKVVVIACCMPLYRESVEENSAADAPLLLSEETNVRPVPP